MVDYVRQYNENVRSIRSLVEFLGMYHAPYNSHLHIKDGVYMNRHNE